MVSDLRERLWTFFEDIRQATMGEEDAIGTTTSAADSRSDQSQAPGRVQESEQTRNGAKTKEKAKGDGEREEEPDTGWWGTESPSSRTEGRNGSGRNLGSKHLWTWPPTMLASMNRQRQVQTRLSLKLMTAEMSSSLVYCHYNRRSMAPVGTTSLGRVAMDWLAQTDEAGSVKNIGSSVSDLTEG